MSRSALLCANRCAARRLGLPSLFLASDRARLSLPPSAALIGGWNRFRDCSTAKGTRQPAAARRQTPRSQPKLGIRSIARPGRRVGNRELSESNITRLDLALTEPGAVLRDDLLCAINPRSAARSSVVPAKLAGRLPGPALHGARERGLFLEADQIRDFGE